MGRRGNKESLKEVLELMGENAAKAAKKALAHGAERVASDAKTRCPAETGNLRNSIHTEVKNGGSKIRVVADAKAADGVFYGKIVEFSPKINKPFLYPAIDAAKESIKDNVINAVREGLKRR